MKPIQVQVEETELWEQPLLTVRSTGDYFPGSEEKTATARNVGSTEVLHDTLICAFQEDIVPQMKE